MVLFKTYYIQVLSFARELEHNSMHGYVCACVCVRAIARVTVRAWMDGWVDGWMKKLVEFTCTGQG